MIVLNPNAGLHAYDPALRRWLSLSEGRAARDRLAGWPGMSGQPTPAWNMPGLARALGIAQLTIKDESKRSALGSFKVLGAPNALVKLVQRRWPEQGWTGPDLLRGAHAQALKDLVVISATDGNHGRALAAAAQSIGCRCVIVLHAQVSLEREQAIAAFGARIVRIAGHYDDSVAEAARLARDNGWEVVSDTSYEGYEDVPRDVMQGYGVIAVELVDDGVAASELFGRARAAGPEAGSGPAGVAEDRAFPWTHVILQGGVGGLAAGIVAGLWDHGGAHRPRFIVAEPEQADCLLRSALAGQPARAQGTVDSVMAGLACGQASPLAWRFLQPAVDLFMTVADAQAEAAMRLLAGANFGDMPVVAGESGAAGLAALQALLGDLEGRQAAGLTAQSRVLVINTEGATAPEVYARIVGRTDRAVLEDQQAWLGREGLSASLLMERLDTLACIGAIDGGGVCRIALTDADRRGRDQLVAWMRELQLEVRVDQIGNIFGIRPGRLPAAAPVMTGSHIDTVATGGRYDGHLGVLAGLEVVRWLNDRQVILDRPLVVAAFTNEEGVRFQPDMMGSLVYAGGYPLAQALGTRDADGARLGDELSRIGYAGNLACGSLVPHAFVELHIEQGPVMEAEGIDIGAVEDLQGISWQEITLIGQSNHAGTTPMRLRRDAGYCAMAIAVFARELALRVGGGQVATVGSIDLYPNLINVIPARASLTVDLRNPDEDALQRAERELAAYVQRLCREQAVAVHTRVLARFEPVRFADALVRVVEASSRYRGYRCRRMTSGAGHDAQMMARLCPSAMIFVPSAAGISHNPKEHTAPEDLVRGAHVLLDVIRVLAKA